MTAEPHQFAIAKVRKMLKSRPIGGATMNARPVLIAFALALCPAAVQAQQAVDPGLGEVLVSANRASAPYAQNDRPVIGLRRQADSAVMTLTIASDTRDAAARTQEIHTVLLAAIDKAAAAGIPLRPVTRKNYGLLPLYGAGRVDTSQVQVLVKARLEGSASATQGRLDSFIRSLKGTGRATVESSSGITLTIINPDQYRDQIVKLVALEASRNAAMFGPDFTFSLTGIDGQVAWSQIGSSDVFLYIPYRYSIVPKRQ
jgi:hypothetical protein